MSDINSEVIFDPHRTILELGTLIEGKGHTFNPATSLGMVMEGIGYTVSTAMQEVILNNKNIYPALATRTENILRHITDEEEKDMFATPSEAYINMYVNINDIIHNTIATPVTGTSAINYDFIISKNSTITVNNTVFSIMDDVEITLFVDKDNNKNLSVLYNADVDSYSYSGIGILPSSIIQSGDVEWGVFQLPVKQLNITLTTILITKDSSVNVNINFDDQYVYSEVFARVNGVYKELGKIFSKDVLDLDKPSILISVGEDSVSYDLPKPFIFQGVVTGDLRVYTYTSKGKMELPLGEFVNTDFAFKLHTFEKDINYTVTSNVTILANSTYVVDGGVDRRPFKDMRNKIISKTAGNIISPTTQEQLKTMVKNKGFTIFKMLDTITDRNFIVTRNTSTTGISPLPTDIDIYLPKTKVSISLENNKIVTDGINYYIKEGALFTLEDDIVKPYVLPVMSRIETDKLLNSREVFISPFTYTISKSRNVITSNIYDIREPEVKKVSVLDRNKLLLSACNITSHRLVKTVVGYDIYLELVGNEAFSTIEDTITTQLTFSGVTDIPIYYEGVAITITGDDILFGESVGKKLHKISIPTDFLINNGIRLYDDLDTTNSLTNIPLDCSIDVHIFSTSSTITQHLENDVTARSFCIDKLYNPDTDRVVITSERMNIVFGEEIFNLWNKALGLYNNDRYMRYVDNIYATYTENIYEQFDGCNYKLTDTDGDGDVDTIEQVLLHAIGDRIQVDDVDVISHTAGEIIYVDGRYILIRL